MLALIGKKLDQTQRFLEDGTRIPVTRISVPANVVLDTKTQEKNKYIAVALGYGLNPKNKKKSSLALAKKANLQQSPRLIKEIRQIDNNLPEIGTSIRVEEVFQPGDIIQVTGTSKGKGFAGGVKRHHFSGGPKTHGQSDRHRAPGSIGQGTTPGRVFKGKRMAGHMGHGTVTVKNLSVISIEGETLLVSGLVPGPANNMLVIKKIGEMGKKFVPLTKTQQELDAEANELAEQKAREAKEAKAAEEAAAKAQSEAPVEVQAEAVVEEKAQDAAEPLTEQAAPAEDVAPVEEAATVEEAAAPTEEAPAIEENDSKDEKEEENGGK